MMARFADNPSLGIASGVYLEQEQGSWVAIEMPPYHAAGACKMMRSDVFRQIGGFVQSRGWDTVDEIRAQGLGWKTQHFEDLQFRHLKREGSGIGPVPTSVMHGEVYYLTGGGKLFFVLKVPAPHGGRASLRHQRAGIALGLSAHHVLRRAQTGQPPGSQAICAPPQPPHLGRTGRLSNCTGGRPRRKLRLRIQTLCVDFVEFSILRAVL